MKKKNFLLTIFIALICTFCTLPISSSPTFAKPKSSVCDDGNNIPQELKDQAGCGETKTVQPVAINIMNVITSLISFIAILMVVIGGINFSLSNGDPNKTKKARDTILYGIIGIVVALLAFAIVNLILTNVIK